MWVLLSDLRKMLNYVTKLSLASRATAWRHLSWPCELLIFVTTLKISLAKFFKLFTCFLQKRFGLMSTFSFLHVDVKVKLSLCFTKHHAMKTYWGSGGIAPCIPNLGARWRWVISFTSRPLHPWYPLDRRLGGPQNRTGCGGEEKSSYPLPGIEPRLGEGKKNK
jgi:hypothetical protein